MYGGTVGGAIKKNRIFSFTSFEDWNDKRPLTIVRTVPTELERRGDFSQSVLSGRVRDHLQPVHLDARQRRPRRAAAVREQPDPAGDDRSGRAQDAERHSAAEQGRQHRQLAGQSVREHRLLELLAARRRQLQRHVQDVRALRPVQGRSLPAEPDRRRLLPAVGQQSRRHEQRGGRRLDHVEQDDAQRARQLLQHGRRVLQPVARARSGRPGRLLADAVVLVALQQRLRLLSGARRDHPAPARRRPTASAGRAASGISTPMRGPRRRA